MHDDDRAFGAAVIAGVENESALDRDQLGDSARAKRVAGRGEAGAGRECGRRSELALSGGCARRCYGEAIERDRRKLDARDHTNRMLRRERDANRARGAADELPGDADRAVRLIVRVVRPRSVCLDVRRRALPLVRFGERHHDHHVELRKREHREREPEPAWAFTNEEADRCHER